MLKRRRIGREIEANCEKHGAIGRRMKNKMQKEKAVLKIERKIRIKRGEFDKQVKKGKGDHR